MYDSVEILCVWKMEMIPCLSEHVVRFSFVFKEHGLRDGWCE